jgi:hypothetical protein
VAFFLAGKGTSAGESKALPPSLRQFERYYQRGFGKPAVTADVTTSANDPGQMHLQALSPVSENCSLHQTIKSNVSALRTHATLTCVSKAATRSNMLQNLKGDCRVKELAFIVITVLSASGCATIVRGTTQTVAVNTPGVPGAMCSLTSPAIGSMTVTTPGVVTLAKGSSAVAIRCSKECYNDGTGVLSTSMDGMAAGNVVAGGVIGLGVDAATGAMNQYAPQADIVMTPDGSCQPPATVAQPRTKRR